MKKERSELRSEKRETCEEEKKEERRIEHRKSSEEDIGRKLGVIGERRHNRSEERRTEERTRKMKKLVNVIYERDKKKRKAVEKSGEMR